MTAGWACPALLLLAACTAVDTPEACRIAPAESVPIHMVRGVPLVDVMIEGQAARLVLDTGADRTVLTQQAFARLKLEHDYTLPSYTTGLGARGSDWATQKVGVRLGSTDLEPDALLVVGFGSDAPFDGVLGGKPLVPYDLDIDMPARRVTLLAARHCPGTAPFSPSMTVPASSLGPYRLSVPITVDGTGLLAVVDTGASHSIVDAGRLGLSDQDLAKDRSGHVATADPVGIAARAHRFRRLQVGSEVIDKPFLLVGKTGGISLLGSDLWRNRRLWVSYGSRTITVGPPAR